MRVALGIGDVLLHPFVVIGDYGFHPGLLKHNLGDPYLDRSGSSLCWPLSASIASTDLVRALAPGFRAQGGIELFPPRHGPRVMDRGKPHCQRIVN
jgi:hypothetical protein